MNKLRNIFIGFFVLFATPVLGEDGPFLYDDGAITESSEANIQTSPISLNPDATGVAVSEFDIAGVILGAHFEDVQTLFFKTKGLYNPIKKNSITYTIPQDWKYNLDYECRQQGIFVPTELEKCVNSLAKKRGLLYAEQLHLIRESTGETLDIFFTSNMTDNQVWRIIYKNDVNELEGAAEKFADQREKKILAFWQNILDKYGAPNAGADKWATSNNSYDPMMTAYYGSLDLVDMGANANDAAQNVKAARENFRAKPYAF